MILMWSILIETTQEIHCSPLNYTGIITGYLIILSNIISCVIKLKHMSFLIVAAATRGVLWKKVFLKISQNSRENTFATVSFLIKLQACNFIKKETLAQVFSHEFCKISRIPFLKEHLCWLLLYLMFLLSWCIQIQGFHIIN